MPEREVNACNPRQAVLQAYNLASLMNVHDAGFCQDGAAAIAAAVAAAYHPEASLETVLKAAQDAIVPVSGLEMLGLINEVLTVARESRDYQAFREALYANEARYFRRISCDSRETIPITLALFYLADGDVERVVTYAANFGRDADTIATMGGAIAGAFQGVDKIRSDWLEKARQLSSVDQDELASKLVRTALLKFDVQEKERQGFTMITRQ